MPEPTIRNPHARRVRDRQEARIGRGTYAALHHTPPATRRKAITSLIRAGGMPLADRLLVAFEAAPVAYALGAVALCGLASLAVLWWAGVIVIH